MKNTRLSLKRCRKQRFEGKNPISKSDENTTKVLTAIATKILNAAYGLKDSKEIIRTAIIDIQNVRSELNA